MDEYKRERHELLAKKPDNELTLEDRVTLLEGYLWRADKRQRRAFVAFVALVLVLGAVAAIFIAKRGIDDSQTDKIDGVVTVNRAAVCGIANNLSLAFRQPVPGESEAHFLDRMQAQLTAIKVADGLRCNNIDGLDRYRQHRREAIAELQAILDAADAQPPRRNEGAGNGADSVASSPSTAPQTPVAPSAPTSPIDSSAPSVSGGQQPSPGPAGPQGPPGDDGDDATTGPPPQQPDEPGLLDPAEQLVCELSGLCP